MTGNWIALPGTNKQISISKIQKSFEDANNFCTGGGGILYEPRNTTIYTNVLNYASSEGIVNFWLGIHDKANEGVFVYESDGTNIQWSDWNVHEPNNWNGVTGEHCVEMLWNGKWNDIACDAKKSFICIRDFNPGTNILSHFYYNKYPLL